MRKFELLAKNLARLCDPSKNIPAHELRIAIDEFVSAFRSTFGPPILPEPNESIGIAPIGARKTAALFFDRIWAGPLPEMNIPKHMLVYGATDVELWPTILQCVEDVISDEEAANIINADSLVVEQFVGAERMYAAAIATSLSKAHKVAATPIYLNKQMCDEEFVPGNSPAVLAAIHGVGVINEARLDWQQVIELRHDHQAASDIRRLRHWLDSEMAGRTISFVSDEIAVRLENYEQALRKHGIETLHGTLSDLLDEKFLIGVSAAVGSAGVTGGGLWAALAGGGLTVGRVVLSISKRMIELRDRSNNQGAEVAFVHELKELTK